MRVAVDLTSASWRLSGIERYALCVADRLVDTDAGNGCVPVSLGLGASLDFEAGNARRAPRWMQKMGLEWLYRMVRDPQRLMRRYLVDDMRIAGIAWRHRLRRGSR